MTYPVGRADISGSVMLLLYHSCHRFLNLTQTVYPTQNVPPTMDPVLGIKLRNSGEMSHHSPPSHILVRGEFLTLVLPELTFSRVRVKLRPNHLDKLILRT
jgi:hypothetical protein